MNEANRGKETMKKTHVDSEERTTRADAARFLRELADRLEGGRVVLKQGGRDVTAEVPEQVSLEVSLDETSKAAKGTKWSLEVELDWYEGGERSGGVELG